MNKEDEESPSEVPDIPTEETDFGSTDFGSTEEEPAFGSTEEEPAFGSEETDFGSTDTTFDSGETTFGTEEAAFGSEEITFNSEETTDFGATDFSSTEETSSEDPFAVEETTTFSELEPTIEPESLFESEPEPVYTPTPTAKAPEQAYKSPENFEDLKKFAESTSISGMGAEGNPSFSVLLKNIRYIEDVNDILSLMKELGLLSDPEEQIKQRLMRGHLLVPRISEYAAIFLAHKLRRFDIDIQVGLSDEIHPPKHQETPETGLVSKYTLYQNQTHHFHFDDTKLEISQIIVAAIERAHV